MVSYPTYDQNTVEAEFARLHDDDVNQPLLDRATMSQLEPGSTVKPMVGLSAIKAGLLQIDETIECTGFLVLNKHKYGVGKCWVATKFLSELGVNGVAHHPIPSAAPHPTGFLVFSDGLERSCNIFFETVADRFGPERLGQWFSRWGLGRPTGIGIAEAKGRLPRPNELKPWKRRAIGWFAGIGQGYVQATPIQMANVAATIARDGIWLRPTLLSANDPLPAVRAGAYGDVPERVDLQMPPEAIQAAKLGMFRVVNSKAGTGTGLILHDDLLASAMVAGKTGTAQASRLKVLDRDDQGHIRHDGTGKPLYKFLEPSTPDNPNVDALWYRGTGRENKDLAHSWYIGFAPVDHPQVAFAVMVEYGGSGGIAAASVARESLEGCIMRHYLTVRSPGVAAGTFVQP